MNKVILTGRLTKDPETRYTSGQMAVCSFTLAVDRVKKSDDKTADFPRVVTFGKTAENVNLYVRKGALVGIEGSIATRSYQDQNGGTVYVTEVIADRVEFLEKKKDAAPAEEFPF